MGKIGMISRCLVCRAQSASKGFVDSQDRGDIVKIVELVVRFTATHASGMPTFKGDLLRGVLGAQAMTVLGRDRYRRFFEGRDETRSRQFERVPPFAIFCENSRTQIKEGETIDVRFSLIDPDTFEPPFLEVLPHFAANLMTLQARAEIVARREWTEADFDNAALSSATAVEIVFRSPLRIEHTRQTPIKDPTFVDLIRVLNRRAKTLGEVYGSGIPSWYVLGAQDGDVNVRKNLSWKESGRFSRTDQSFVDVSGVLGTMRVQGNVASFLPLLMFGSVMQAGLNVTRGCGAFQLTVVP